MPVNNYFYETCMKKMTDIIKHRGPDGAGYLFAHTGRASQKKIFYEKVFTEKIFQAFEGGTIPLYWAIDLPEPEIINKNKYCFCNTNNIEELEKSIHNVSNNPDKYIEGALFTKNAGNQIQLFYITLLENILLCLQK